MSSDGSRTTNSSRISQFGLYRTIDSRTEEFLKLSRKRQIRQGCACAAVSTAITVTVVITVLLVYEYSVNVDPNAEQKLNRKNNWLNFFNESTSFNKGKLAVDPATMKLLPIILKALSHNKYLEKIMEDSSAAVTTDKKYTTEGTSQKPTFTDLKKWFKMPTPGVYTIEYKTSPIHIPKTNIDYLTRIKKIKDRRIHINDKIISERISSLTAPNTYDYNTETTSTTNTIISQTSTTRTKPTAGPEIKRELSNVTSMPVEAQNLTSHCKCPRNLSILLSKLAKMIQQILPEIITSKSPCKNENMTSNNDILTTKPPIKHDSKLKSVIDFAKSTPVKNCTHNSKPRKQNPIKSKTDSFATEPLEKENNSQTLMDIISTKSSKVEVPIKNITKSLTFESFKKEKSSNKVMNLMSLSPPKTENPFKFSSITTETLKKESPVKSVMDIFTSKSYETENPIKSIGSTTESQKEVNSINSIMDIFTTKSHLTENPENVMSDIFNEKSHKTEYLETYINDDFATKSHIKKNLHKQQIQTESIPEIVAIKLHKNENLIDTVSIDDISTTKPRKYENIISSFTTLGTNKTSNIKTKYRVKTPTSTIITTSSTSTESYISEMIYNSTEQDTAVSDVKDTTHKDKNSKLIKLLRTYIDKYFKPKLPQKVVNPTEPLSSIKSYLGSPDFQIVVTDSTWKASEIPDTINETNNHIDPKLEKYALNKIDHLKTHHQESTYATSTPDINIKDFNLFTLKMLGDLFVPDRTNNSIKFSKNINSKKNQTAKERNKMNDSVWYDEIKAVTDFDLGIDDLDVKQTETLLKSLDDYDKYVPTSIQKTKLIDVDDIKSSSKLQPNGLPKDVIKRENKIKVFKSMLPILSRSTYLEMDRNNEWSPDVLYDNAQQLD